MTVIPTVAQVQGLAAMAVHEPAADFESVVVAMSSAAGHVRHGAVTVAERAAMTMAGPCRPRDVLGVVMGDFVEIGRTVPEVAWAVVERLLSAGGELLTVVAGAEVDGEVPGQLADRVRTAWPGVDVEVVYGGQPRYPLAAGAGMTLRLAPSPWRTDTFRRLNNRLENVVGAKTAKPFEALKIWTVGDLMRHLPRRYFSGTELSDLSVLRDGEEVTVLAEVVDAKVFGSYDRSAKKPRLEATITDRRGYLTLTFFGQSRLISYWQSALQPGARGIFAGKVREFNRKLQLAHPDFVILDEHGAVVAGAAHNAGLARAAQTPLIGLYPLSGKLRTWTVAECAGLALETLAGIEDPVPAWVRQAAEVVDLETAFRYVHQPRTQSEIEQGRDRIRFDEAFGLQLTMAYRRSDAASHRAEPRPRRVGGLLDAFDARLPFTLTRGQVEVGEQIFAELAQPRPMQRLLQGEVGSGKTLVALRAMLAVIDAGGQAALLAPTEVLAGQHFHTLTGLMGDLAQGEPLPPSRTPPVSR